jgi:RNA polymerase primary sigma factor
MNKLRELKISHERLTKRTDNINRYFSEVEKIKMLNPDEEFRIACLAQKGDEAAIDSLVRANLRFVISVAKQYSNGYVPIEDLICQGNIGLIYSAKTFDPTKGFRFISYAVWHIRKEILQYFTNSSRTVKVPQSIVTILNKIRKIDETFLQSEGRTATVEEIQEELAKGGKIFNEDQIKEMLTADGKFSPLENTETEDVIAPIDWIEAEGSSLDLIESMDRGSVIERMASVLTPIQREVVFRKLGIGLTEPETLSSIAIRFDRTPEWARQVYDKSIRKMKAKFISRASYMNI